MMSRFDVGKALVKRYIDDGDIDSAHAVAPEYDITRSMVNRWIRDHDEPVLQAEFARMLSERAFLSMPR